MRSASILVLAVACALAGCSTADHSSTTTTDAAASPAADASASPLPSDTAAAAATPAAAATAAGTVVPSAGAAAAGAAPAPLPSVGFTDIAAAQGRESIVQLAQLGVFDTAVGAFAPTAPVKRRDFVRWLVKANNALWSDVPTKQIHLADASEKSDLSDVAGSDPDFPYVQGLSDAGIAVGFPDKSFKPDASLTREQMIAIKSGLDRGGVSATFQKDRDPDQRYAKYHLPAWKDRDQVSKTYVPAIATDIADESNEGRIDNIGRTFGAIAQFRPQQPVTRAQAAVCMTVIGSHTEQSMYANAPRSAAAALAPKPSPTP